MKAHLIKGFIKSSRTGHPLQGLRIEAWSTEALINVPLANGITDENGRFMLTFNEGLVQELLRHNPQIYFRIWQEEVILSGSHDTKNWNVHETTEEIGLEVEPKSGQDGVQSAIVTGTVYQPDNTPAPRLTVKAFDKDLRSETALGEAITDANGKYSISYDQRLAERNEYQRADILMRVYKDNQLLFETDINDIVFNAPARVNIDIHLKESTGNTFNEYEKYLQILSPVTGKITLDTLEESSSHPDITFLNRETGIDYHHLEYLALSYKIRQQFQFEPTFFYGLFREGTLLKNDLQQWLTTRVTINISSDVKSLVYETALIDTDTISAAIIDAIAAHIIPDISKALPVMLRQLQGLQEEAKKYIQEERPRQWANLLVGSVKDGSYKKLVELISQNAGGNLPQLLNSLITANPFLNAVTANDAAVNINIASLLGTDDTLIQHVKATANIKDEHEVSQLAALSTDEWKNMLNRLPNDQLRASMTASADALDTHATILQGRFRQKYPHVAFMADFKRDQPAAIEEMKQLPVIDLGGKPIDTQLKDSPLSENAKAQLRSLQRLYKLTPDYNKAKKLQADRLTSAYHIVGLGQKQFITRYSKDQTFTEKEAAAVYQKAVNIHTAAMTLGAELKEYGSAGKLKALNGEALSLKIEQVSKDFPNLKSLFQEIDLCECMDCRSVYGPAAYLADVLQFLKNRLLANGTKTAKDVLFARRPDIGDIDLNCDNANTPIPYIDLVCEVLEDAVSPDLGILLDSSYTADIVVGKINAHFLKGLTDNGMKHITDQALLYPKYSAAGVDTYMLRDTQSTTKISAEGSGWRVKQLRQTHLSAAELNAAPEYINDAAYQALSVSHISFGLPFDIYQQRSNSLLEIVNIERADLMDTLGNAAGPDTASKAAVYLKISPAERTLIITPDATTAGQAVYWNTGALPLITTLQEVDVFLKKSGLSYVDLQQLLTESFINPGNNLFIQHLDNTCDTAKKIIANLDEPALDRIHRFLRLYRRTGISMDNLNSIIMYTDLGNQQLNDATLILTADLLKLQNSLGITLEQALSFYGQQPASPYTSVYLNRIATNPIDEAFTVKNIAANELLPVGSRDTLNAHLTTLGLSLKLRTADITFLISQLNPADTTLTRDNLAFLYRHGLLANLLGLKVQELFSYSALAVLPLFTTPAGTSALVASVRFMQAAGFTVSDLQWFLQNSDPTGLLTMQDTAITTWLTTLQGACQQAFNTTQSTFNAALTPDENKNNLKQQMNLLPGIAATVVDKMLAIVSNTFADALSPQAYVAASLGAYFDTLDIQSKITTLLAMTPGDPNIPIAQNALIQSFSTPISLYLFRAAKQTALYNAVQNTFGVTDVVTQVLLQYASLKFPGPAKVLGEVLTEDVLIDQVNTPPVPPVITPGGFEKQYRATRLLKLMVSYFNKIGIQAQDLQWFLQNNAAMGWLELDTLRYQGDVPAADFDKWVKWQTALQLMQNDGTVQSPADPNVVLSWTDVWGQVASGAAQLDIIHTLTLFTGWDINDVNDLVTWYGYIYPADFKLPATWQRLGAATAALRLLGVPMVTAAQFIKPVLTNVEANLITQTLRNKYDDKQWLNVIQPVEDALRPQKRDALVAYLLAFNPDLNGPDDLYDYFLMDVLMQPGQPSSRIVMAHGILQLFIQRCLMALEPNAIADVTQDDGWSQWLWMKNFQVWVANRKVFLYPENWIQPELRTDQSYFFADLISELQQNEITDDNVETAAIHYLEKLDDVASLDVRACYYDVSTYTMHVIARVRGGSTYYYRTGVKERKWEPWTKVDVDISGDHLLAYMLNNRLFLAWHLPTEEIQQGQNVSIPSTPINQPVTAPLKRYKVQLATSECINGVWQPKRTSQDVLYTGYYNDLNPVKDTFRMLDFDMGTVGYGILCTFDGYAIGMFNLTGCKGYPEVANWGGQSLPYLDLIPDFMDTQFLQMQYRENDNRSLDTLSMRSILSPYKYEAILNKTPGIFRITYPHEFSLIDWIYVALELMSSKNAYHTNSEFASDRRLVLPMASFMPFFYADGSREYVIIPGFFGEDGKNERTFSDIYKFVTDLIALVIKYVKILLADPAHDLNKLLQQLYADPEYIRLTAEWDFYKKHKPQLMFRNFYHPLVCYIKSTVYKGGLPAIMTYEVQSKVNSFNFNTTYQPQSPVATPYPIENIDFDAQGSYSSYNWELFYHLPFFIGNQLSQNQQFEEARKWYHYIFNPIGGAGGTVPQKYWITKPFHEFFDYVSQRIDTILTDIASDPTGTVYKDLVNAVESWRENPFMPHEIARTRPLAYQKSLLMKYLENLIAWGDNLFMQNTMESLVQATQMYILADKLLGPKPMIIPPAVPVPDETYNQLELKLDAFSNAMVDLENLVPDLNLLPHKGAELPTPHNTVSSLYFCIPANDHLLSYWDTIADRLYKIRNCEDINGVHRVLALFAPPIDPGMLVRAAAAGLDISAVTAMLNAPLPLYRFHVILQKATELAEQVKAMGAALLSALEKKDNEALALLRAGEEIKLQQQLLLIRQTQVEEATQSIDALQKTKAISQKKFDYYSSRDFMNGWEIAQAGISAGAIISEIVATVLDATSGGTHMIPIITGGGAGFGGSPVVTVSFGGNNVGSSTGQFGTLFRGIAGILHSTSGLIGNIGAYQRRMDDWNLQKDLASLEMTQVDQQIVVANIRKDVAVKETTTQQLRIQQAQEVNTFMTSKYTNKDLYAWMTGQISTLYFQSYQLAFAMAKQAEQCYQFELATDSNVIQYNYWDTMKKGLLSGDRLLLDVKRLESNYLKNNQREFELTKNISIAALSPEALMQLRNTGQCDINIPEMLFDTDYPGHYLRRIKAISVSIPCISGPLVAVSCTLSQVSNKYRKNTQLNPAGADAYDKYVEKDGGDDRFTYNIGAIQSIATSHAQNDTGLFELNFHDDRYLPFEGTGAISSWHLEMNDPASLAQFDYQSITDVIIQMSYTSRQGGGLFKKETTDYLKILFKKIVDSVPVAGLFRMFDLRHELSDNWYAFMNGTGTFSGSLTKAGLPYFTQNSAIKVTVQSVALFVLTSNSGNLMVSVNGAAAQAMTKNASKFGSQIQLIDPISSITGSLKLVGDHIDYSFAVQNFNTVKATIAGAWLVVNYTME
ncbi:neuraminidase-like domain-containing protein [Chitinophaga eiseniae]|uniref:Virulence plasmid A protein n=1 Tax=Chitinophaga eiseniae TaxID=634771 RepID=A0A847SKD1_9BACT|nr:neuraminidase-like domain-containing protein [Chitinophaga eiseniae]NLR82361.1 hypothetical protein [Chitinophaga eiseniae]